MDTEQQELLKTLGLHATLLKRALENYYNDHQRSHCHCMFCKEAEKALASMAQGK